MKVKNKIKNIAGILISFILIVGLFSFTSSRNNDRQIKEIHVTILGNRQSLISRETIKNLLSESLTKSTDGSVGDVHLAPLEKALDLTGFLYKADVFLSIKGDLYARARQRVPILRVVSSKQFYIDSLGHKMPLSKMYSPRLPIYWDWSEGDNLDEIHTLARKIHDDPFLKKNIAGLWREKNEYQLRMRYYNTYIGLGGITDLDRKMKNFKALYHNMLSRNTFDKYSYISLKYKNQVICKTKLKND